MKQIVGSTLRDSKDGDLNLITNFESDKSAAEYATLYKQDGLKGGHVIMLGADPLSNAAALEALHAYPGKPQAIKTVYRFSSDIASELSMSDMLSLRNAYKIDYSMCHCKRPLLYLNLNTFTSKIISALVGS